MYLQCRYISAQFCLFVGVLRCNRTEIVFCQKAYSVLGRSVRNLIFPDGPPVLVQLVVFSIHFTTTTLLLWEAHYLVHMQAQTCATCRFLR